MGKSPQGIIKGGNRADEKADDTSRSIIRNVKGPGKLHSFLWIWFSVSALGEKEGRQEEADGRRKGLRVSVERQLGWE